MMPTPAPAATMGSLRPRVAVRRSMISDRVKTRSDTLAEVVIERRFPSRRSRDDARTVGLEAGDGLEHGALDRDALGARGAEEALRVGVVVEVLEVLGARERPTVREADDVGVLGAREFDELLHVVAALLQRHGALAGAREAARRPAGVRHDDIRPRRREALRLLGGVAVAD